VQPDAERLLALSVAYDQVIPPGDPGAVYCGLKNDKGQACGRGRQHVGPGRALMCPVCDAPSPSAPLDVPDWPTGA
jgi:hypothetical protein